MDTLNKFMVGSNGDGVVVVRPPAPMRALSQADALNLAAWLVVLSGATNAEFGEVLAAVENA